MTRASEIVVLQSWYRDEGNTVGDAKQRQFYGVAPYFADPEGLQSLLTSGPRAEVRNLITRLDLMNKLGDAKYRTRLVFVSNAPADEAGDDYASTVGDGEVAYELWTQPALAAIADRTNHPGLLAGDVELPAIGGIVEYNLGDGAAMAVALVPAKKLVENLPGIGNLTVFSLNVRLGLGNTRINKELAETVRAPDQHELFPAYHNGMTLLTNALEADHETGLLHLTGVSIVNGCQSLLALYRNEAQLTDALTVIVKVVQVKPGTGLETKITYRANNQNPVNIRDQRSTHPTQVDLQTQIREEFGDSFFLAIREGEKPPSGADVLDNRVAAQLIMAIWLSEPWDAGPQASPL